VAHLMFCLRRLPHLTREQFQRYWREVHAPLVRSHADALGLAGYVQNHALPEGVNDKLARERGSPTSFDGVAQLWWHDQPIFLVEDHEVLRLFADTRDA